MERTVLLLITENNDSETKCFHPTFDYFNTSLILREESTYKSDWGWPHVIFLSLSVSFTLMSLYAMSSQPHMGGHVSTKINDPTQFARNCSLHSSVSSGRKKSPQEQ